MKGGRRIGIDLGTTNCCVASLDSSGKPYIIDNHFGENTTASMVSFTASPLAEESAVIGSRARRRAITNPEETVYGAKRLIGRRYDDSEVQAFARTLPFPIVCAANGDAWIEVAGVHMSPQEISSIILRDLHDLAVEHFGDDVEEVIITVPAHFDNAQRRATSDAAAIAGLNVRRLLNEPTAAALGYGAHRGADQRLAVCDLGGGTFDVSIVNVEDGIIEVISSQGDLFLGGDDIDRAIMEALIFDISREKGLDIGGHAEALQRLKAEVILAKHTLSEARSASVDLRYLGTTKAGKNVDYMRTISREEVNAWVAPVLARLDAPCREAASRCGLRPSDVDAIILVGGMTRMPAIQAKIGTVFGKPPLKVVNPDEIVSIGAATQCAILDGRSDAVLLDVTSRALGLLSEDGKYQQVIPRNASIPTREHRIVATVRDDQREIEFEVFEGESANVRLNRQLGRFVCKNLPEAPAGEVMLLVEFTVDVDGMLHVSTSELASGTPTELRMTATAGLSSVELAELRSRH